MVSKLSTEAFARESAGRPWIVIGIWGMTLLLGLVLAWSFLSDALTTDFNFTSNPESKRAETLLEERLRGPDSPDEIVIVRSDALTVDEPAFKAYVEGLYQKIMGLGPEIVEGGLNYYQTPIPALVSTDRSTIVLPIALAGDPGEAEKNVGRLLDVINETNVESEFEVLVSGDATMMRDFKEISEKDFRTGDLIGIGAALVILALVFGAVAAAVLPVVLGLASLAVALGTAGVIGLGFPLFFMITIMIAMVGLAVGIDYSLFIVSRYQEERQRGLDQSSAIATAGATASRAVLFSGMTVVVALLAMFIVPIDAFRSMALGAVLVVFVAVLAALTLLPAVLSLLGDRINALRIPLLRRKAAARDGGQEDSPSAAVGTGFWEWTARAVMRYPLLSVVLATGLLIAAAAPALRMDTGMAGIDTFPDDSPSKEGFLVLQDQFSGGLMAPVEIVIDSDISSPPVQAGIQQLRASLGSDPRFGPSQLTVNPAGDLALLSVPPSSDPMGDESYAPVRTLRAEYIPEAFPDGQAEVLVGGDSAWHVDFFDTSQRFTPIAFAFVLGLSFVLLTVVFRSLVVPVKAIVMNLLSVGAAYGLLVLVFQEGVGAGLLGFQRVDKIEAWLPLFLFSILFGLSMDYHVFLLSRIRERFDQTGDNTQAVAFGLRSTGSVITGAAAIMVAVFAGFATGDLVAAQQMGFGLAVAVLLDATIVRSVLVPATMRLLGEWNWYLPSALRWLPHLGIEGRRAPEPGMAIFSFDGGSATDGRVAAAAFEKAGSVPTAARSPSGDENNDDGGTSTDEESAVWEEAACR